MSCHQESWRGRVSGEERERQCCISWLRGVEEQIDIWADMITDA